MIAEVLDADGDTALCVRSTEGTTRWQAAGLAIAAADRYRAEVTAYWEEDPGGGTPQP